ncbi:DNA gyrase inhibitor YacG [Paremcibacter congregatus]|uniref:DNA gyrase inhibitor YacG n=1 Tax=Paremcibacter congregatus TaxID=2043170 RepID=UPI0030EBE5DB|tara:strand:- start:571 stop:765 length:195 start_codon:yes stop_codon:yes gene_type:complete
MQKPIAANSNNLCTICTQHPATPKFHPFCSARCADVDLGRWLKGNYAIPGEKAELPETDPEEDY